METIVNFILEAAVSLGLLSLFYLTVSRRYNTPQFNRFFLIFSLIFSVLVPFLSVSLNGPPETAAAATGTAFVMLDMFTVYGDVMAQNVVPAVNHSSGLKLIYLIGFIVLTIRLIWALIKLNILTGKSKMTRVDGHRVIITGENYQPFTFLQTMVIPKNVWESTHQKEVLIHESIHVKQKHSIDLILLELILVIQWFNPFAWLIRRFMQENHEFLADKAVIAHGFSIKEYQKLLLYEVMGVRFELGNNFNHSLTKKRLKMMTHKISKKRSQLSGLLSALLISGLFFVFACETEPEAYVNPETAFVMNGQLVQPQTILADNPGESENIVRVEIDGQEHFLKPEFTAKEKYNTKVLTIDEAKKRYNKLPFNSAVEKVIIINMIKEVTEGEVFVVVEKMPQYPGGHSELMKYLSQNIKYPYEAQQSGVQGKVFVQYVVSRDGAIKDVKVVRSSNPQRLKKETTSISNGKKSFSVEEITVAARSQNGEDFSSADAYQLLDDEAIRIVKAMPNWEPGFQRGKPVNVQYMLPISFVLQGGVKNKSAIVKLHGANVVPKNMIAGYNITTTENGSIISGQVIDEDEDPLPGASIILKGTTIGTVSNKEGRYSLPFNYESNTIVFSFVGLKTHEIKINEKYLKKSQ